MERLTERTPNGIIVKEDYGEQALKTVYQCHGERPNPHYTNCDEGYCAMEKLANYEDAEEQGLLLRLPCKVGTRIYAITYDYEQEKNAITESKIIEVTENGNGWFFRSLISIPAFRSCDFGKTVFLTREEAEAKLKEMEGSHE